MYSRNNAVGSATASEDIDKGYIIKVNTATGYMSKITADTDVVSGVCLEDVDSGSIGTFGMPGSGKVFLGKISTPVYKGASLLITGSDATFKSGSTTVSQSVGGPSITYYAGIAYQAGSANDLIEIVLK